jgi:hypothetical protein
MSSQQRVAGDTLKRAPEPERWAVEKSIHTRKEILRNGHSKDLQHY